MFGNESSSLKSLIGMKVPGNEGSRERRFQGTKVPRNESSTYGLPVPYLASIFLWDDSLQAVSCTGTEEV